MQSTELTQIGNTFLLQTEFLPVADTTGGHFRTSFKVFNLKENKGAKWKIHLNRIDPDISNLQGKKRKGRKK